MAVKKTDMVTIMVYTFLNFLYNGENYESWQYFQKRQWNITLYLKQNAEQKAFISCYNTIQYIINS